MSVIHTLSHTAWESHPDKDAVRALEKGKILFLPQLQFHIEPREMPLISPIFSDPKAKNISLNIHTEELRGAKGTEGEIILLKTLLKPLCAAEHSSFKIFDS